MKPTLEYLTEIVELGIRQSIEEGDITPIDHGYCFCCENEKPVYEAGKNFPPQPPLCHECLVGMGVAMAMRPEFAQRIEDGIQDSE